ncbi:MAG TPA: flagellar basal body protein [Acidimicrobiales bacterium]|nr:flagellar basal body protein [Acidimicrobiales bacterium]
MADAVQAINILNFALDSIQQRQQVLANNIANQDTPGFQASVVTFENSLSQALQGGGTANAAIVPEGLQSGTNGNNVSLPAEMSLMSQTGLENQAVSNALTSEFTSLQTAIQG